jgi:hypothetical protein
VLSRFLRAATQATDSILIGWTANKPATVADRQRDPVSRVRPTNSNKVLTMCKRTLVQ